MRPSARGGPPVAAAPFVALFVALSVAAPGHAQPVDPALGAAMAAREAGRTSDAVARFEALARERPADASILRLLGTSYAAAGRYARAAATLEAAQRLAPRDRDIALARARVALWRGGPARAAAIADAVAAAEPDNMELPALRASIAGARSAGRPVGVTATQGVSRVSLRAGRRTWTETALAGDVGIGRGATLTGEVEHLDRGRVSDTRGALRIDAAVSPALSAYLGASATPDADFRERWAVRGGGEARLGATLTATLDARYADYGGFHIVAIEPGLRIETRDARFAAALRSINLIDDAGALRTGAGARIEAAASSRVRLFAGGARYSDAEAGVVRRVDSLFAGADVTLTDALTLRVTVDHDRRVSTYSRSGVAVGLRWRPAR